MGRDRSRISVVCVILGWSLKCCSIIGTRGQWNELGDEGKGDGCVEHC